MSDAYSEYLALLDDIEHIPIAASEASGLSPEERAVVLARVLRLVRDRILFQSRYHNFILVRIDELAQADPRDCDEVQWLLYRLYADLGTHFASGQLMMTSAADAEGPSGWFG
jgi:hypothetical protein